MGLYDTMKQVSTPMGGTANGTSAQKQPIQGRGMSPATSGQRNVQNGVQAGFTPPAQRMNRRPNPTMGQIPGQMGSNSMIQAALKNQGPAIGRPQRPQYGLPTLQSPYDAQQIPVQSPMQSPMQAAAEQMRGYNGPDLGSQDPRELLRIRMAQGGGIGQPDVMNRGLGPSEPFISGQSQMDPNPILNAPIQPMRPVQMDENGLEPRRGAR